MQAFDIRETFLRFYEERGHKRYDSFSLIPNDPTLLLTVAGMVPFKPYFLGDAVPESPRATSFQKCARTNDIENVGLTTRHLTFFEMLGNFSFGDYFKREAMQMAWQLSIEEFGLDPDRIWVTIYEDDQEAGDLWNEHVGVPRSRIQALGKDDNFWSTGGAGPCGPCSELYYDRGPDWGVEGGPAVNDERYLEYYNLVFMQYERDQAGAILGDLPQQNVDTGLGLERLALILQDVPTVFETDVLAPMVRTAEQLTGHTYGADAKADVSLRVIAEHARTSAFLITDGVLPAKEGRGYVLRRLLRRAVRHAELLGTEQPVMAAMIDSVIETMAPGYPDLTRQRDLVQRVAQAEEADFGARLKQGLTLVDGVVADLGGTGSKAFPAATAFQLHDTFGFPIDLTIEIAASEGLALDRAEFDRLMDEQRVRARKAAKRGGDGIPVEVYREAAASVGATDFLGYEALTAESTLGAIVTADGVIASAQEGDEVEIVLPRTPFYAEGGGQVGDHGTFETASGRLEVLDTQQVVDGLTVHRARVVAGEITAGQDILAVVDADRRAATARAHSATHVLHATMKQMLGEHAQQAGSLVQPGRLRFDFPHFDKVSRDQVAEIEATINERVLRDPFVRTEIMGLDDARRSGAVANFGDKYGQTVRVVTIGEFSKELCGGTHVGSGASIGTIQIVREESIGSNTRRIEALTGMDAYRHGARERLITEEVARLLSAQPDEVVERLEGVLGRLKSAERDLAKIRAAAMMQQAKAIADATERADGVAVVTHEASGVDADGLRQFALEIRGHLGERAVVVLGQRTEDGKAQLVCAVSTDLADAGVQARPILHPAAQVVGGGAGGKGDLAQAGGKDGTKLTEALEVAAREARQAIG